MDYKIVEVQAKTIEGLLIKTENAGGKCIQDIGAVWHELFSSGKIGSIKNSAPGWGYGVYCEYEGDEEQPYSYLAGMETGDTEKHTLTARRISPGKYAKFTAKGDLQKAVGEAWQAVWSAPLKRKYDTDFEEYTYKEDFTKPEEINIYIGIED